MKAKIIAVRSMQLAAVCLLVAVRGAQAASVTLEAGSAAAGIGAEVAVPILAEKAQKMGALLLDLTYDPGILEALELDEFQDEDLAAGASVEANVVEPGRWRLALARSEAIEGTGVLLRLKFRAIAGGESTLNLENVQAWDQTDPPLDMLVNHRAGAVVVSSAGGPIWIYAIAGVAGLVVLAGLAKALRGKNR
jgi:hypothetical protein